MDISMYTSLLPERSACRRDPIVYYRISNHYKFVLMQLFDCFQYEKAILVEDDMQFSPDFFSYFGATAKLLQKVWSDGCTWTTMKECGLSVFASASASASAVNGNILFPYHASDKAFEHICRTEA